MSFAEPELYLGTSERLEQLAAATVVLHVLFCAENEKTAHKSQRAPEGTKSELNIFEELHGKRSRGHHLLRAQSRSLTMGHD